MEHGLGYMKGQRREMGSREPKEQEGKPTWGSRNCESAKRGWGMVKGRVLGRTEGTIRRTGSGTNREREGSERALRVYEEAETRIVR